MLLYKGTSNEDNRSNQNQQKSNNMQVVYVSLLCSPRLHLFDEKHSKTVILWDITTIWFSIWMNRNIAEFSAAITPVYNVIWLEIILICLFGTQETFLIISNVENSCAA